jgi:hypothetical protein
MVSFAKPKIVPFKILRPAVMISFVLCPELTLGLSMETNSKQWKWKTNLQRRSQRTEKLDPIGTKNGEQNSHIVSHTGKRRRQTPLPLIVEREGAGLRGYSIVLIPHGDETGWPCEERLCSTVVER